MAKLALHDFIAPSMLVVGIAAAIDLLPSTSIRNFINWDNGIAAAQQAEQERYTKEQQLRLCVRDACRRRVAVCWKGNLAYHTFILGKIMTDYPRDVRDGEPFTCPDKLIY